MPRNVFTYIFLSGFFTPGVVFALTVVVAAIFVVYEPRWMVTFDDVRYLRPPGS